MTHKRKASFSRRAALKASGAGLITVSVAGCSQEMTPRDAKSAGAAYQTLSARDVSILEALGETLVPGARDAGIAPYVDAGLTAKPEDSLLMIRYLDVPSPWNGFYQSGLAALDQYARTAMSKPFDELPDFQQSVVIRTISRDQPDGWSDAGAPPAPFFYFALRGDAIDVTWGTQEGFERFEQPYLAHIEPPSKW